MARFSGAGDSYPLVRSALRPDLARLPDRDVERIVADAVGPYTSAAELEEFIPALIGGIAKIAGPLLSSIVPGLARGVGAAAGGGGGSILSKLLGGLLPSLGGLFGGGGSPAPGPPGAPVAPTPAAPLPGGGLPAAGQLLGVLARPEVLQGLLSLLLGQAGRSMVPVAGPGGAEVPVPAPAFAGLVQALAGRVVGEYAASDIVPGEAAYLMSERGEFIVDPADPQRRADVLLDLLRSASESEDRAAVSAERWPAHDTLDRAAGGRIESASDEFYDAIVLESDEALMDAFGDEV